MRETIFSPELAAKFKMKEQDFTRNRKQPFSSTLLFMFNLLRRTLAIEIDGFVRYLNDRFSAARIAIRSLPVEDINIKKKKKKKKNLLVEVEENPNLIDEAADKVWGAISAQGIPYAQAIEQLERRVLQAALKGGDCTRKELARRLCTSERTLYHKIRTYELRRPPGL